MRSQMTVFLSRNLPKKNYPQVMRSGHHERVATQVQIYKHVHRYKNKKKNNNNGEEILKTRR